MPALSEADALAAFFERLGYNTSVRRIQTPANLGITTDSTLKPIKKIELLADQDGLLQVYLFELRSVTVVHTRAIASAFRLLAGNYLLVLTSDYEPLDFVLLERERPTGPGSSIGAPQVKIRPRTLTAEPIGANPSGCTCEFFAASTSCKAEPPNQAQIFHDSRHYGSARLSAPVAIPSPAAARS